MTAVLLIAGALAVFIFCVVSGGFHEHRHKECYGGVYADEPGGPRYVHEIWWECDCGNVIDAQAKRRAEFCMKYNISYVKPGEWPSPGRYFA